MNQTAAQILGPDAAFSETSGSVPAVIDSRSEGLEDARQDIARRSGSYTPVKSTTDLPVDKLKNRYVLHCNDPLPQYIYGNVRAYAVTDESDPARILYAAISDPARPYRHAVCEKLKNFENPYLIRLVDEGVANVSIAKEYRHVIVFERPTGKPLSEILAAGQRFNEASFINNILRPAYELLSAFEDMGVSHSRIQADSLYLGEHLQFGDCLSEPSGYSKHFLYEPVERLLSIPEGRGAATIKIDTYDLGVLAIECMGGLEKLSSMSKEAYVNLVLNNTSYNVLVGNLQFSDNFSDFLIGVLNDQPKERWSAAQLGVWLNGKRFNLLRPSPPRDANRPYDFNGQQFFNGRALANNFFINWDNARNIVRDEGIPRWLEQSIQRKETAEQLRKTIRSTGGFSAKSTKYNDELLSRVITTLDPEGPLRFGNLSFNIDVVGNILCDAIKNNKHHNLSLLSELLEFDLPNYWADMQPTRTTDETTEIIWKIERTRPYIKMTSLGFGMERFMYEMNPHTPCLSAKLQSFHLSTLEDVLYTLDTMAEKFIRNDESLLDRHLAAFIAARAGIVKESVFKELAHYPILLKNQELQMMLLLAKAQERSKIRALKGLSYWVAYRLISMLGHIHSSQIRETMARDILHVADHGHIGQVLMPIINTKLLNRDTQGFITAINAFRKNRHLISDLSSVDTTKERATRIARGIASAVSLAIFFFSLYTVLSDYVFK